MSIKNIYQLRSTKRTGFTIIELMLAMSFVAVLLIAITILTMNISRIYNRGLTYKELNQTGAEIADDFRRSFTSSMVDDIKYVNNGTYNRLCLGKYSYVWNEVPDTDPSHTKYGSGGTQVARLLKVTDPAEKYCNTAALPNNVATADETRELLSLEGNRDLYVYSMTVSPLTAPNAQGLSVARSSELATQRGLYTIKLTLGTGEKNRIDVANTRCNPPVGANGGDEYCAIDTFTTVVAIGNTYAP